MVTKCTNKEEILALHGSKRGLADGLLERTSDGGRLSDGDMLALVRDPG